MKKCKMCEVEITDNRTYCSNKCKFNDTEYNKRRTTLLKNDKSLRVDCKLCDYSTSDIHNLGGHCTTHLKKKHNIIVTDYSNYYNLVEIPIQPTWKCPICEWKTTDIENKSGCITNHITKLHNIPLLEFNIKYPNNTVNTKSAKIALRLSTQTEDDYVECKICGEKLSIISNTHCLNKHHITQQQYKDIYGDNIISKNMSITLQPCGGSNGTYVSLAETEIYDYINSIGIDDAIQSYKIGGIEIDVYSPKYKIGIEFNGLYWHSELHHRGREYHIGKTNYCESKGIKLIHIFEDEWNNKKDILKSKIKYEFNKFDNTTVYARRCELREISQKDKSEFLNKYHIQGDDKSVIRIGAYYQNELIAVSTFTKKRIILGNNHTNGEFELSRFASNSKYKIIGILPKMIKLFAKLYNVSKIITYADRRYSNRNNIYEKIGFKFIHNTKPNYYYMKRYCKRLHRYNFTKHRIIELGGDINLTEWENMIKFGYDRIWDCGNLKYEMNF